MTAGLAWVIVTLGFGVVVVRRRSVAVALVTAQALFLAGVALADSSTWSDAVAAVSLAIRAIVLAAFFWLLVHRTRESRPVRAPVEPVVRAAAAVALALALVWLVPDLGLGSDAAQASALSLLAIGLVTSAMRSATLFQVLGIVIIENALALAALSVPGDSSLVIETGVTVDLFLIALVAGVFHERIFVEFGSGDSARLRSLRD